MKKASTRRNVVEVCGRLAEHFSSSSLGNRKDPFEELVFVLISTKTNERNYARVFSDFRRAFHRRRMLLNASVEEIQSVLAPAGLSRKKAAAIHEIVRRCAEDFGRVTLSPLRGWSNEEAERYLCGLPGVGKKVARCVLMYSFGRSVFPVDTHCWRVARRLGWFADDVGWRLTPKLEDDLQEIVPPDRRYRLHVDLVRLGRATCLPKNPRCSMCPVENLCAKQGIN